MDCPKPVKRSSRTCFGIMYFATEEDADKADEFVRERGDTYNGGYFHGMICGREESRDYFDKELDKQLYAVTER